LVFLSCAAAAGAGAYFIKKKQQTDRARALELAKTGPVEPRDSQPKELSWDDVQHVDTIGLEVGYRLIPLVDKGQGGELLGRIKGVRKKLSQELGFLVPAVHIRDNLDLSPNAYRISLMGVASGEAEIRHDCELAINPGQVYGKLDGIETKDPAFGLDAVWIAPEMREHAQTLGYTVVDASTVVATHISQLLSNNAAKLLGYEEVQQLLEMLGKHSPKLVDGFIPDVMPLGSVVKVMQNLLNEG
ncbi:FHIPEP family type III secretion protein, partial [Shewanella sp. 0m-11]